MFLEVLFKNCFETVLQCFMHNINTTSLVQLLNIKWPKIEHLFKNISRIQCQNYSGTALKYQF